MKKTAFLLTTFLAFTAAAQSGELPSVVQNITATPTDGEVTLNWTEATDPDGIVIGYVVYYGENSVTEDSENVYDDEIMIPAQTSYTIDNLTNGNPYYFAVVSVDDEGNKAVNYSPEVSATPGIVVPLKIEKGMHSALNTFEIVFNEIVKTVTSENVTVVDARSNESVAIKSVMADGNILKIIVEEGMLVANKKYRVTAKGITGENGSTVMQGINDSVEMRAKVFESGTDGDTMTDEDVREMAIGTGSTELPTEREYVVDIPEELAKTTKEVTEEFTETEKEMMFNPYMDEPVTEEIAPNVTEVDNKISEFKIPENAKLSQSGGGIGSIAGIIGIITAMKISRCRKNY